MIVQMKTQDRNISERRKKSIRLSRKQHEAFNKYANSFNTILDCAEVLELGRNTISNIRDLGRCSQDTYDMLVEKSIIPKQEQAA
jgi:hypothetical protein